MSSNLNDFANHENCAMRIAVKTAVRTILQECPPNNHTHSHVINGLAWYLYDDKLSDLEKLSEISKFLRQPRIGFNATAFVHVVFSLIANSTFTNVPSTDYAIFTTLSRYISTGMLLPDTSEHQMTHVIPADTSRVPRTQTTQVLPARTGRVTRTQTNRVRPARTVRVPRAQTLQALLAQNGSNNEDDDVSSYTHSSTGQRSSTSGAGQNATTEHTSTGQRSSTSGAGQSTTTELSRAGQSATTEHSSTGQRSSTSGAGQSTNTELSRAGQSATTEHSTTERSSTGNVGYHVSNPSSRASS